MLCAAAVLPLKWFGHLYAPLRHLKPFLTYPCGWIPAEWARFDKIVYLFLWWDAEIYRLPWILSDDNNVTGGNLRRSQVNVPGGSAAQRSHSSFYFQNQTKKEIKRNLKWKYRYERNLKTFCYTLLRRLIHLRIRSFQILIKFSTLLTELLHSVSSLR